MSVPSTPATRAPAKLLVVDDNPVNLKIFALTLELIDAQVASFDNGLAALRHLETSDTLPEVLIIDRLMPGMDGLEVVARVRSKPEYSQIRILMASAAAAPGEVNTGLEAGVDRYLTKPFTPQELLDAVAELRVVSR